MKRIAILLIFTLVGLAAAGYRPMLVAMEQHTRMLARNAMLSGSKPLVLDAMTKNILAGANRVQTFRLIEDEDSDPTAAQWAEEQAAMSGPHVKALGDYTILHAGPSQGKAFATRLAQALASAGEPTYTQCFSPGVGFRVWKGQAHVDLCVCFYCSGVEITTTDAKHKAGQPIRAALGRSRAAFLALSRQAFPQDSALAAIKDTQ